MNFTGSILFVVSFSLLSACNSEQEKTCRYEEEYNRVSAELKLALEKNASTDGIRDPKFASDFFSDIVHMSCVDYQRQYKLSDKKLKEELEKAEAAAEFLKTFGETGEYLKTTIKAEK